MRSPSRMVGFIEPEGTSFQSASEERTENSTSARISNGRISLRHQRRIRERKDMGFIVPSTKPTGSPFNEYPVPEDTRANDRRGGSDLSGGAMNPAGAGRTAGWIPNARPRRPAAEKSSHRSRGRNRCR